MESSEFSLQTKMGLYPSHNFFPFFDKNKIFYLVSRFWRVYILGSGSQKVLSVAFPGYFAYT